MNKSETLRKKLSKKHLDVSFQFLIYFAGIDKEPGGIPLTLWFSISSTDSIAL